VGAWQNYAVSIAAALLLLAVAALAAQHSNYQKSHIERLERLAADNRAVLDRIAVKLGVE
jgi:hypothetical protein